MTQEEHIKASRGRSANGRWSIPERGGQAVRDETAEWLNPMVEAIDGERLSEAIQQASMPAAEADSPSLDALAAFMADRDGVKAHAVDWVRVGQLLRAELSAIDPAWNEYPEWPGHF